MVVYEHVITGNEPKLSFPTGIAGFYLVDKRFRPRSVVAIHLLSLLRDAVPIQYEPIFQSVIIGDQKIEFRYAKISDPNAASLIGVTLLVFLI